ncbi:hypothetical protein PV682_40005 [Streptomyces niveiscabiei]|uniref:hypothetical protein n=1 Tax=Streptomyces niveiscabiei TaxID=164115 RepID=UPI0029B6A200|nr:hypothetical protein [Streptomyces niveiscabiei]MDX3387586.1 hypothetical protein [Streptomyces niveiscabiei]
MKSDRERRVVKILHKSNSGSASGLAFGGMLTVVAILTSGCYVDTGQGKYPESKYMASESLVGRWKGSGSIELDAAGRFSTKELKIEYFQCSPSGLSKKTGVGSWDVEEEGGGTTVSLRFDDGCSASLWAGESHGKAVLWSVDTETDQVSIFEP